MLFVKWILSLRVFNLYRSSKEMQWLTQKKEPLVVPNQADVQEIHRVGGPPIPLVITFRSLEATGATGLFKRFQNS